LAEQDKVLESNLENLNQKSHRTEYVKSSLYDIANFLCSQTVLMCSLRQ